MTPFRTCSAVLLLVQLVAVEAHIAIWAKGMFGRNWPDQATDDKQNWNNNWPIVPLRKNDNLNIKQWFGRGLTDFPPPLGEFMELEAGGVFTGEHACNRAYTHFRHPAFAGQPFDYYACKIEGPLHTKNRFGSPPDLQYLGGTALAIAYTSDVKALHPHDLIVISVNHTGVWTRETEYRIPCGLPKCPAGGCLCTWNWIHQAGHGEGYGEEIYNNMYRCNVSGETSEENVLPLGGGTVPVGCVADPALCVKGPKQPMYVYQAEGNNMPHPTEPPTYNQRYGFADGAQLDIFHDERKTLCPDKTKTGSGEASSSIPLEVTEAETTAEAQPGQAAQPNSDQGQGEDQAVFKAQAPGHAHKDEQGAGPQAEMANTSGTSEYEILFDPFRTGDQAQQAFLAVPIPTAHAGVGAEGDDLRRGF